MKISGSYTLDATRDEVWAALNDIDVLARVVPGCERLEQVGENEFEGRVKIGIQSIRGVYNGKIRLEDIQPPRHYKLVASGKSANGVVDGAGMVDLEELEGGKTQLTYGGDAQIGGVLASVGQRLIEGASRQLINQSLKALAEQIALRRAGADAPQGASAAPEPAASAEVDQARPQPAEPAASASAEPAGKDAAEPARAAAAVAASAEPAAPSAPWRTVVVPEHEQLKPESVLTGMLGDLYAERPWVVWVFLAFVIGYLLGKSSR